MVRRGCVRRVRPRRNPHRRRRRLRDPLRRAPAGRPRAFQWDSFLRPLAHDRRDARELVRRRLVHAPRARLGRRQRAQQLVRRVLRLPRRDRRTQRAGPRALRALAPRVVRACALAALPSRPGRHGFVRTQVEHGYGASAGLPDRRRGRPCPAGGRGVHRPRAPPPLRLRCLADCELLAPLRRPRVARARAWVRRAATVRGLRPHGGAGTIDAPGGRRARQHLERGRGGGHHRGAGDRVGGLRPPPRARHRAPRRAALHRRRPRRPARG